MILIDLNVVLDVIQKREPHYRSSAAVLERVIRKEESAALPAHTFTTAHYLISRFQKRDTADQVIGWLLDHFMVAPVNHSTLTKAKSLNWQDFEDAVVAAAAHATDCTAIITRNVKDFRQSPVTALTPDEYLLGLDNHSH